MLLKVFQKPFQYVFMNPFRWRLLFVVSVAEKFKSPITLETSATFNSELMFSFDSLNKFSSCKKYWNKEKDCKLLIKQRAYQTKDE